MRIDENNLTRADHPRDTGLRPVRAIIDYQELSASKNSFRSSAARTGQRPVSLAGVLVLLTIVLSVASLVHAVPPIPADQRLVATIATTFAGPAADPMHMPTDLAIDSRGNIVVADGANDRLAQFGPDGLFVGYLTGVDKETFARPVGVAFDAADNLWVADTANHRVLVISPGGQLLKRIELPKGDNGNPAGPTSVAVTRDGARAYIVDNPNHRLIIRDNRSEQLTMMGKSGRALGQFEFPFMVCIGLEKYVFITEAVGARVQQVSPDDRWAGTIGHVGVMLGDLYRPKGIATDSRGRVFVSDSSLGVIQAFTPRGFVAGVLTDAAGQPLKFEHPMGMRFDAKGNLLVVELRANRVAVVTIQPPNKPTATTTKQ
jgi:DNA-binding beta-propeller fold protein YncE